MATVVAYQAALLWPPRRDMHWNETVLELPSFPTQRLPASYITRRVQIIVYLAAANEEL